MPDSSAVTVCSSSMSSPVRANAVTPCSPYHDRTLWHRLSFVMTVRTAVNSSRVRNSTQKRRRNSMWLNLHSKEPDGQSLARDAEFFEREPIVQGLSRLFQLAVVSADFLASCLLM